MNSRSTRLALHLCFIFLASLIAGAPHSVSAQDLDDVTISGRITDQNGAVVAGATVTAVFVAENQERTAVSDAEGRYRLIELKPGVYLIRVTANGFANVEQPDLTFLSGDNRQLNYSLTLASVRAETVVISEDTAPAVDTTRTVVGGTVTEREIEELPNVDRTPLSLVFTLGGVAEETFSTRDLAQDRAVGTNPNNDPRSAPLESGIFSLSGGAAFSNNITIDGLDNNDDRLAQERFQPSLDTIAEVQVITNQFSAEYGRASGGRVNLRTRAGTNKFRGRAYLFFRDDNLNANTFNNNRRIPFQPRLPFTQYNPGFTFGGPVPFGYFKNKTFFFAGYEYDTSSDTTLIDTLVPVAQNSRFPLPAPNGSNERRESNANTDTPALVAPFTGTVQTPTRNHNFTARIDHNFTDNHSLTFNYEFGRRRNPRQSRNATSRLEEAIQGPERNTDAYKFTDNYVFSPNLINQFRFQYSVFEPQFGSDSPTDPVLLITLADNPLIPVAERRNGTLIAGNSTAISNGGFPELRNETRYQFQNTLSAILGAHTFKFGADVQRIKSDTLDLRDATGTYNFFSVNSFINNRVERFRRNFGTQSNQRNTYAGFFVQDEWRAREGVTVSLGLRYERESIFENDDDNNFGPRAAIAIAPFKDNKGVIRVGGGIFYNRILLRTVDNFTFNRQRIGGNFDSNQLTGPADSEVCFTNTGAMMDMSPRCVFLRSVSENFPNAPTREEIAAITGTAGFVNPADNNTNEQRRIDPDLQVPESYQFNVGFEREVANGFVFEANYTFNRSVRLFREFNINGFRLPAGFSDFNDYLTRTFTVATPVNIGGTNIAFENRTAADPDTRPVGTVTVVNLASSSSQTTAASPIGRARAALAARADTARPINPNLTNIEQVASIGNATYNGLILELRRRPRPLGLGFRAGFRMAYTLSKATDDGNNNTTNAQFAADFSSDRARSTSDRRHRLNFSGTFDFPRILGGIRLSPNLRYASSAPFSIGSSVDRNLNNNSNDRPNFSGNLDDIRFRNPGDPFEQSLADAFTLPLIGANGGNLPRNAGQGPNLFLFDLNLSREFRFGDRFRLRPNVEVNNVFNSTVFNFGAEFINFANAGTATFREEFLVPTRTLRERQIRLGVRFDF